MRKLSIMISLALALIIVGGAQAHAADMYFHTHTVSLSPDEVRVVWELVLGPMIAQSIWYDADLNQDEVISSEEALAWAHTSAPVFSADLDGTTLVFEVGNVEWPSDIPELLTGEEPIRIHLQADWVIDSGGEHQVTLQNRYNPQNSLSFFEVFSEEGIVFETPGQDGGQLRVRFESVTAGETSGLLTHWESGRPSVPWMVESLGLGEIAEEAAAESGSPSVGGSSPTAILEGLIKNQRTSSGFILAALAIAVLLGALHALSPGHGKTIVAAYLVGSQGRFYHAVALGAVVTLTHTGSVFALGLLTLTASRYFFVTDLFPILELVSGLLIFILGIGLLYPRLRDWRSNRQRQRQMEKRRPVELPGEAGNGKRLVIEQPIEEVDPPHSHDPSEFGYVPKGPPSGSPLEGVSWRSLVALGVSGGLVPCPDAIAILLIAATINRVAFGLSLIVAFSIGLAVILIAIGVLVVQGKRLFERLQWFEKVAYTVPVLSAVLVLGIGAVLTFAAVQNISETSPQAGIPVQVGESTPFDFQRAQVIYADLDEDLRYQLFVVPASGGEPEKITSEREGVWSFYVAPDGDTVIYVTPSGSNGSRLWALIPETAERRLFMDCQSTYCSDIVWSPDGGGMLYGRLDSAAQANVTGITSLWWYDLTTNETAPLFQDANMPGFNPRWSPDGKWLSYTSINPQQIQIYQVETGESLSLPTQTGAPAVWSPDGETMLLVDIQQVGENYLPKIFRYDLLDRELTPLDADQAFDENYPSWSPTGEWIVMVRRDWGTGIPVRGNQAWLIRPDGSEAHPVTADHEVIHGQPAWSPDGRYLLYDVDSASTTELDSGINILDIETGDVLEIAPSGNRSTWLP